MVDGRTAAGELGVSERTIRRYVVALHELGIPVDGQPGVGGGYRLRAGTRLPPLMFDDEEAAAVVLGLAIAERRGLSGAQGALAKIGRVLPARLERRVDRLRGELSLSGEPEPAPTSTETLLVIAEAVRRRRSLRIDYTRRDGARSEREIDPFGLVARHGRWYVPARDHASAELRTFRADRIGAVEIGDAAEPPEAGFDPVAHVVQMLARLPWAHEVEVQVDAPSDDLAARIPATLAQLSPDGDGNQARVARRLARLGRGRAGRTGGGLPRDSPARAQRARRAARRAARRIRRQDR